MGPSGTGPWILRVLVMVAAASLVESPLRAQGTQLYPAIEPNRTGELRVSETHAIYWESSGNEDGIPLIALHGGPGGRSSPVIRRLFDPERYRIIQFDQRGAGKSRPFAEWRDNDTHHLMEDIDRLRAHLGVSSPPVLFGLSWGTTLALAYAEARPAEVAGLVLLGVFTCTRSEIDHFYHGGVRRFYPDAWEMLRSAVPEPDELDYPKQLFEVITGPSPDAADRAATLFVTYEEWLSNIGRSRADGEAEAADPASRSMAVLENHYLMNGCFLDEGQLLDRASLIEDTPVFIGNGRLDMLTPPVTALKLAERLSNARVEIVAGAGHVDLPVALAGVRGTDWVLDRLAENRGTSPGGTR
ncbi:MAG: alpha/beta fold hydrolase [Gemmatimonadota bacterium]|nr:alpha/beta fold hydrolase [Gemmatimonadota bacterium]